MYSKVSSLMTSMIGQTTVFFVQLYFRQQRPQPSLRGFAVGIEEGEDGRFGDGG